MFKTAFQQGRRRSKTGSVPERYVEDFDEPRTRRRTVFSIRPVKDVQNGFPARPQAKQNRRRTRRGTLRILLSRERGGSRFQHPPSEGCSKRPSSKAAGEAKPEAYPQRYVEDFDEPRTRLGTVFSIRPVKDAQNGLPARPQAKQNRRRTRRGTLRILLSRERCWRPFSASA